MASQLCADDNPTLAAKDAQGGAAGEWDGRHARPTREQVRLLIVGPVCFIPERQLGTIPYT